jgi:hypothetical protein
MVGGWCQRWSIGLAMFAAVVAPSIADAAWLGYKNNTTAVVVIQASDVTMVNGQPKPNRPGKAHTLYPGEVAWDPITASGPRMISIFDPKQNNRLLFQDRVDCNKNDIFLSLQLTQPPAVRGQPQPAAALKLLPTVLPAQAPGILPTGSMPPTTSPPASRPAGAAPPAPSPPVSRPPTAPMSPAVPPASPRP